MQMLLKQCRCYYSLVSLTYFHPLAAIRDQYVYLCSNAKCDDVRKQSNKPVEVMARSGSPEDAAAYDPASLPPFEPSSYQRLYYKKLGSFFTTSIFLFRLTILSSSDDVIDHPLCEFGQPP